MNFTQWVRSIGGTEAIVEQIVNKESASWYGYWRGLSVTLILGGSSITKEWSYYEFCDLMKNENGSDSFNVTGQASKAEKYACEYLRSEGYYVVTSSENYPEA